MPQHDSAEKKFHLGPRNSNNPILDVYCDIIAVIAIFNTSARAIPGIDFGKEKDWKRGAASKFCSQICLGLKLRP